MNTENNWIKIEDELPPFNVDVLCFYSPTHPVMEGRVIGILKRHEFEHLTAKFQRGLRDKLIIHNGFSNEVTHWQYLPEKPTQVTP